MSARPRCEKIPVLLTFFIAFFGFFHFPSVFDFFSLLAILCIAAVRTTQPGETYGRLMLAPSAFMTLRFLSLWQAGQL